MHLSVYYVRQKLVVLDRDLAAAFGVETKQLKRVVKRHPELFTGDETAFELTMEECSRCQNGTMNEGRGSNIKYLPFAFTQAGVQVLKTLMKSSVEIEFEEEPPLPAIYEESWNEGTVVLYSAENLSESLEVKVTEDNVWLNRNQIAILFGRDIKTISKHINNAMMEELQNTPTVANFATVQTEGGRDVLRYIEYYNLDMVLSVGYRVKSPNGVAFRRWANKVIKEKILYHNYLEKRVERLEIRVSKTEKNMDMIINNSLPPAEQIFM
ncbi:MAG: ORF6N domain-containing protein, partial [Paludibacteraceae bacterium]|nr:ORF6N domain-containing protein [Paludibacteraceae bacterium]